MFPIIWQKEKKIQHLIRGMDKTLRLCYTPHNVGAVPKRLREWIANPSFSGSSPLGTLKKESAFLLILFFYNAILITLTGESPKKLMKRLDQKISCGYDAREIAVVVELVDTPA